MLSVGAICFEDRCRKVKQGEVGGCTALADSAWRWSAACRKALADAGWAICLQQEVKGCFFHFAQALNHKI